MMNYSTELSLPLQEKAELINDIIYWQKKRWERLKSWRTLLTTLPTKHFFMKKEIDLIRSQEIRLAALVESIINNS